MSIKNVEACSNSGVARPSSAEGSIAARRPGRSSAHFRGHGRRNNAPIRYDTIGLRDAILTCARKPT